MPLGSEVKRGQILLAWKLHGKRPCRWIPKGKSEFFVWWCRRRWTFLTFRRRFHLLSTCAEWIEQPRGAGPEKVFQRMPSMKKKVSKAVMGDARHRAPVETELLKDCLPLIEHCAVVKYDDNDPREPGWITIKTQGAAWIVQVKDPDSCTSFSIVGETLDKALQSAALLLACDEAPWEPDSWLASSAAKKKKAK